MDERFDKALRALERRSRRRVLASRAGLDFSSNDYLGLATEPKIGLAVRRALEDGVGVGAGASRLLRGNHPVHRELEDRAAKFFRAERALFFGSGYLANTAIFSTLPQRGDLVVHDEFIHASVLDGLRLSRAQSVGVAHNNCDAFSDAIKHWRKSAGCSSAGQGPGRVWIAVESLYSMDGDPAPLGDLLSIAEAEDAYLVVDEAHATGVYGEHGEGLMPAGGPWNKIITLHTCGKALGVMGAVVCGTAQLVDFLVNRARPFIYATAPSPLMAVAVMAALDIVQSQPERRKRLQSLVQLANSGLARVCGRGGSGSQIIPIMVGRDSAALSLANALQTRGFDIRAIRPPTVPEGTARLRMSVTLNVSEDDVRALLSALGEELERLAA